MKKVIIFVFLMVCASKLFAGEGTSIGKISLLYVNGTWTMVQVPGITNNPDACASNAYYALNPGEANYEVLHSTLVAAYLADRRVRFWVSGCGGQNGSYPKILSIWVYPD